MPNLPYNEKYRYRVICTDPLMVYAQFFTLPEAHAYFVYGSNDRNGVNYLPFESTIIQERTKDGWKDRPVGG